MFNELFPIIKSCVQIFVLEKYVYINNRVPNRTWNTQGFLKEMGHSKLDLVSRPLPASTRTGRTIAPIIANSGCDTYVQEVRQYYSLVLLCFQPCTT